ncbi:MAG: carboxypeptidase regulatory-like domain-containing protein [Rhodothermales bacterium]
MRIRFHLAAALAFAFLVLPAHAQSGQGGFSVSLRQIPLDEALAYFSRLTGQAVSFDPRLVDARETYCAIEQAGAEAVLACILRAADLDYIRLSSGTYVVVPPIERQAQRGTLQGMVIDRRSGRPLADAHVYLASAEGRIGAISRDDGQFILPPLLPGRYVVMSSYVGYEDWQDTLTVHPGAGGYARIEMASEPVLFSPVIVDGIQRSLPSERLLRTEIYAGDTLSLAHTEAGAPFGMQLASLPGVRMNDVTADIHIQGGEAGDHQLKLDNVPIFLPRALPGILGPFSSIAIDRIVVHKSGFDAATGSHLAGVTEVTHTLETENTFDAQLDPLALNVRLSLATPARSRRKASFMGAFRNSIDMASRPYWLRETLNSWAQPDAFLILAPLRTIPPGASSIFEDVLAIEQDPNPTWSFRDVHAATRIWTSPLNALHVSFYSGHMKYGGALPSRLSARVQEDSTPFQPENFAESVALAVVDQYDAVTNAGQATYSAVLSAHTFLSLQARFSHHEMRHDYTLLDSLETLIPVIDAGIPPPGASDFILPTHNEADLSRILETGLEARIEHAFDRHFVTAGLSAVYDEGQMRLLLSAQADSALDFVSSVPTDQLLKNRVASTTSAWTHAAFLSDRMDLGDHGVLDAGIRLSYLPAHETAFAEPRVSLRFDWPLAGGGALAWRSAAGLYRQYLSQYDVSTFNAGTVLPSMRVWLPVDQSVQPPKAYHLAQSLRLDARNGWSVTLDGYYKWLPQSVSLNYLYIDQIGDIETNASAFRNVADQQPFLAEGKAVHAGGSAGLSYANDHWRSRIVYDYTYARRHSPQLFDDRKTTLPWVVPHRVAASLATSAIRPLILSIRWNAEWGRSWAFRQAYYDYFGQSRTLNRYPPYDLGAPDRHILKPYQQIDLSAAYIQTLGRHRLQARLELLNIANRRNEVDWRFVFDTDHFEKEARYLYPRNLSIAVRWIW